MRLQAIASNIAQKRPEPVYLAIGDSIVEMANLPAICGRQPINAGISGATLKTFETEARRLADLAKPDFIVVGLGTNDGLTGKQAEFAPRLDALLKSLTPWPVILLPVPHGPGTRHVVELNELSGALKTPQAAALTRVDTTDGIHLAAVSYDEWKTNLAKAAEATVCR